VIVVAWRAAPRGPAVRRQRWLLVIRLVVENDARTGKAGARTLFFTFDA
jgi:hypothetical protein